MQIQTQIGQLMRIYNTLLLIETRGENTLTMADCLRALQEVIKDLQNKEGEQL